MYKRKNKTNLEKSKQIFNWIKRKIILIITAIMLGMSNAMYDENKMISGNHNYTEQEHKKD